MDIQTILDSHSDRVIFFSREECIYCDRMAQDLEHLEIPFEKITVPRDDVAARDTLVSMTKLKSFPQLFIAKEFIGGYDSFTKLLMTNQLQVKLAKIGIDMKEDF
jgi:monothiol glutaredoxin